MAEAQPTSKETKTKTSLEEDTFDIRPTRDETFYSQTAEKELDTDTRDPEAQQQEEQQTEETEDVQPRSRGSRCCRCLCWILLLFIILAALGGGLIAYGTMGCFKAENKNTKKCRPKGAKKSDASFTGVGGSWGTYMTLFLFELMMFLMF
ncbi:hypothetical protein TWF718_001066 [Orbilia javanica]|uniref:Uncharacterized protein n=1 Tax=Orbilia javanica TaxID=47235 RepID=A0AAN8NDC3_9PEZI